MSEKSDRDLLVAIYGDVKEQGAEIKAMNTCISELKETQKTHRCSDVIKLGQKFSILQWVMGILAAVIAKVWFSNHM